MNLETRVETLEHELKILKNEIEETLLEIQNQILIHYYPALRADDSTPPQDLLVSPPTRPKPPLEASPPAAAPPPTTIPSPGSQMKEVSLNDLRKAKAAPPAPQSALPTATTSALLDAVAPEGVLTASVLAHLAKWVTYAVERVGKTQATLMVESCVAAGACSPPVQAALQQLLALAEDEAAPAAVETAVMMDVLLRLNRVFDQIADTTAEPAHPLPGR